jgi:hypothetical protein
MNPKTIYTYVDVLKSKYFMPFYVIIEGRDRERERERERKIERKRKRER